MSSNTSLIIYPQGSDWYVGKTNDPPSLHHKFTPDSTSHEGNKYDSSQSSSMLSRIFGTAPIPRSLFLFNDKQALGLDELTAAVRANNPPILEFAADEDPVDWSANLLYEGADDFIVNETTVAVAADFGADDMFAAVADVANAEEIAEAVLLILGSLALRFMARARKNPTRPIRLFDRSDTSSIVFINETKDRWNRDSMYDDVDPFGVWNVSQSPSQTMNALGQETLSEYQNGVFLGMGPQHFNVVWANGAVKIGAQIQIPYQQYHIGPSPYGQIKLESSSSSQDWHWPGPDSSSAQDFDFDKYHVRIDCSSAGTWFKMQIKISEKQ